MSDRQLTTGEPVPEDGSHRELRADGQQKGYIVLTPEERAKGFVKPVRHSYVHAFPSEIDRKVGCGVETRMDTSLAETYARNPRFYSGTFCVGCKAHFPLDQFVWDDGEPMHPDMQEAWHIAKQTLKANRDRAAAEQLERTEQTELARLKAKYESA